MSAVQLLATRDTGDLGTGSDFDGVSGPPNGLDGVSKMPALIAVLLKRGYKKRDLKKILGENYLRVIREVTGIRKPKFQRTRSALIRPFPSANRRGGFLGCDLVLEIVGVEAVEPACGSFGLRIHEKADRCAVRAG